MGAATASAILGLWVMVSRSVFESAKFASNNNYIVGPLVITFSIISLWSINRNMIKLNMLTGVWLVVTAFALHYPQTLFYSNIVAGALIILLSTIKRKSAGKFGGGWRSLFQPNPPHLREAENMAGKNQWIISSGD